jgi:CDP-glycerol glycerophosphotransferase
LLPIDRNKIVFSSYAGKQYSDNPRLISEFLYNSDIDVKIVWLLRDAKNQKQKLPVSVKVVEYESLRAAFELFTAKVWVDNIRKPLNVSKRKCTYYIQTWHGTPLKLIEMDAGDKLSLRYHRYAAKDSQNINMLISGNRYSTQIFRRAFLYQDEIYECGTPRNDILVNNTEIGENFKLRNNYKGKKIILFAPTFRNDDDKNGIHQLNLLNPQKIIEIFRDKFNSECIILTRFHPNVADKINFQDLSPSISEFVFDGSKYPDIQEILCATDVLITDYSSIFFDYSLLRRPILLFTPDEKDYIEERGFYTNLADLPLLKFNTSEEMIKGLCNYDLNQLNKLTEKLLNEIGDLEKGNATSLIVERIKEVLSI